MNDLQEYATTSEMHIFKVPERSDWKCYLFGGKPDAQGLVYIPAKGNEPNWFWRKMQYLILGNLWVYEPERNPPA